MTANNQQAAGAAALSYDEINGLYKSDVLPKLQEVHRAMHAHPEARAHFAKMGFQLPDISGLKGEICKDWPLVRQFVQTFSSIPLLTVFFPQIGGIISAVSGFVAMFDKGVIPAICPVGTAASTAAGGAETSQKKS